MSIRSSCFDPNLRTVGIAAPRFDENARDGRIFPADCLLDPLHGGDLLFRRNPALEDDLEVEQDLERGQMHRHGRARRADRGIRGGNVVNVRDHLGIRTLPDQQTPRLIDESECDRRKNDTDDDGCFG